MEDKSMSKTRHGLQCQTPALYLYLTKSSVEGYDSRDILNGVTVDDSAHWAKMRGHMDIQILCIMLYG